MADKVKYGVRKVHYAVMTDNGTTYSYATPVAIPGAVALSLDQSTASNNFYADDTKYFAIRKNNGYTGSLEVAYLPEKFMEDVFGYDKATTDKAYTELADTPTVHVALLFEEEGDSLGTKFALYDVVFERPSRSLNTTTDSVDPQTQSINFEASARRDSKVLAVTGADTLQTVLDAWYTSVWEG